MARNNSSPSSNKREINEALSARSERTAVLLTRVFEQSSNGALKKSNQKSK
jgi:hypothetical protein